MKPKHDIPQPPRHAHPARPGKLDKLGQPHVPPPPRPQPRSRPASPAPVHRGR